jgi:hypothetical protein
MELNICSWGKKVGKAGTGAELRTLSWVVAQEKLRRNVPEGMRGHLRWFGKGAGVRRLEEKGVQDGARCESLNRRTAVGVARAIAGLADAMLLREKGWHAWRSGGLTLFLL